MTQSVDEVTALLHYLVLLLDELLVLLYVLLIRFAIDLVGGLILQP